jgi:hypothetical protein
MVEIEVQEKTGQPTASIVPPIHWTDDDDYATHMRQLLAEVDAEIDDEKDNSHQQSGSLPTLHQESTAPPDAQERRVVNVPTHNRFRQFLHDDDPDYLASCQPSLAERRYAARIKPSPVQAVASRWAVPKDAWRKVESRKQRRQARLARANSERPRSPSHSPPRQAPKPRPPTFREELYEIKRKIDEAEPLSPLSPSHWAYQAPPVTCPDPSAAPKAQPSAAPDLAYLAAMANAVTHPAVVMMSSESRQLFMAALSERLQAGDDFASSFDFLLDGGAGALTYEPSSPPYVPSTTIPEQPGTPLCPLGPSPGVPPPPPPPPPRPPSPSSSDSDRSPIRKPSKAKVKPNGQPRASRRKTAAPANEADICASFGRLGFGDVDAMRLAELTHHVPVSTVINEGFVNKVAATALESLQKNGTTANQRYVDFPVALTPEQAGVFQRANPGLLPRSVGHRYHQHPLLHENRERAESEALAYLATQGCKANVVDINGAASRHYRLQRDIWSTCPIVTSRDVARAKVRPAAAACCDHLWPEAPCRCSKASAYLMVDALYYYEPHQIAELCLLSTSNTLVAVHHVFEQAYGGFLGEAQYHLIDEKTVTMTVKGNAAPYTHSNLHWLMGVDGLHVTLNGVPLTLCWYIVQVVGAHQITAFTVHRGTVTLTGRGIARISTIDDRNLEYGERHNEGTLATTNIVLETKKLDFIKVFFWGSHIITWDSSTSRRSIVPRQFVDMLTLYTMGRPRNPETFAQLLGHARTKIKNYQVPACYGADTAFAAASVAFTSKVVQEAEIMHATIKPLTSTGLFGKGDILAMHTDALKFKFRPGLSWKKCAAVVIAAGAAGLAAGAVAGMALPAATAVAAASIAAGMPVVAAAAALVGAKRHTAPDPFSEYRLSRASHAPVTQVLPMEGPVNLPATPPTKGVTTLLEEASTLLAKVNPAGLEKAVRRAVEPLLGAGILSTQTIPIVPTNNAHTSLNAMIDRQGQIQVAQSDEFDPQFFSCYQQWKRRYSDQIYRRRNGPIREPSLESWLRGTHYSEPIKARIRAAHAELVRGNQASNIASRGFFPKVELLMKGDLKAASFFSVDKVSARAISSGQAQHNAATGPWLSAFSKYLHEVWGLDHYLCYTPGYPVELLGERWANHPCTVAWEGDHNRLDRNVHAQFLSEECVDVAELGAPTHCVTSMRNNIDKAMYDRYGSSIKVNGTRNSGDNQTSSGNTSLCSTAKLFALCVEHSAVTGKGYEFVAAAGMGAAPPLSVWATGPDDMAEHYNLLSFACGDDSADKLTLPPGDTSTCSGVVRSLRRLGLDWAPKQLSGQDIEKLSYCSSYFYPADVNGSPGTVLAPPIGRVLAKIGYYTNPPPNLPPASLVRGDALGRLGTAGFLPFVGSHLKRLIKLTSGHKAAKFKRDLHKHQTIACITANEATWSYVNRMYELTKDHAVAYDALLQTVSSLPCIVDYAPLYRAFCVDGVAPNRAKDYAPEAEADPVELPPPFCPVAALLTPEEEKCLKANCPAISVRPIRIPDAADVDLDPPSCMEILGGPPQPIADARC